MEHNIIAATDRGRVAGKVEVAEKLLKRNRPIEEIAEDTGMTIAEIVKLRNNR